MRRHLFLWCIPTNIVEEDGDCFCFSKLVVAFCFSHRGLDGFVLILAVVG